MSQVVLATDAPQRRVEIPRKKYTRNTHISARPNTLRTTGKWNKGSKLGKREGRYAVQLMDAAVELSRLTLKCGIPEKKF